MRAPEVIIVGLGTAGAATCLALARKGIPVLGLDAHAPPHTFGSHHGESRGIRRALFEDGQYVPMAQDAWEEWRKLERDTATKLLTSIGHLTLGRPEDSAISGFLKSARTHNITHEELTAEDVRKRWPQLNPPDEFVGGLEPDAGLLYPERCITTILHEAQKAGAVIRFTEPVESWVDSGERVFVTTSRGEYEAEKLLISAGAHSRQLLGYRGGPLTPNRTNVYWCLPESPKQYSMGTIPTNFWQLPKLPMDFSGKRDAATEFMDGLEFYSIPATAPQGMFANRVKVVVQNKHKTCDPDMPPCPPTQKEQDNIRAILTRFIPGLAKTEMFTTDCMYTLTPDNHFALGLLPERPNTYIAALAGHGFKYAPTVGKMMADMLTGDTPQFDPSIFAPERFC